MIKFPNKKYNIIYADPAWSYKAWNKKDQKTAERHYPTMDIEDIKNLDVQDISEDNCVLFLWVTFPNLQEGLDTMKAWGFTYKTVAFTWIKLNKRNKELFWGLGHYTRANAEICILGTKGKLERKSKSVHQVIQTPIEKHSKKPNEVRERIINLYGKLPTIELFARETYQDWDSWGNEI
tara:strand:- start:217 stop:753 length:537 start_codon:yes stop_codon:yes gene_type:complete